MTNLFITGKSSPIIGNGKVTDHIFVSPWREERGQVLFYQPRLTQMYICVNAALGASGELFSKLRRGWELNSGIMHARRVS